jgi:hypothetical protein
MWYKNPIKLWLEKNQYIIHKQNILAIAFTVA